MNGSGMIDHLKISLTGLKDSLTIMLAVMKTVLLFILMVNGTMHPVTQSLTTSAKETKTMMIISTHGS